MYWKKKYNLAHWGNKYDLAHILRIGEISTTLRKLCAYIEYWRNKYNLAQTLRIGEISTFLRKSCAYIAHWGKYNLAQMLRMYCALGDNFFANLAHILPMRNLRKIE